MTMSPIGVAPTLANLGLEMVLQMTCRDRNRIALQADLLAAAALGVRTISCMYGDPIEDGDPARSAFDLDTIALLRAAAGLKDGHDMTGHALNGALPFFIGAVANPGAADLEREVARMEEKVEAGAQFFQTQAVYDVAVFERFMKRASVVRVPIIVSFIVLKSAAMARRWNATLADLEVPEALIDELGNADDEAKKSIEITGRILRELRQAAQGLHLIAVGWESRIPEVLELAGVSRD
jgi:5,10-methylenetetrahydrofolate reductase